MTKPRIKEIYDSCFDLTETFRAKSYDELKVMLDEHYHCIDPGSEQSLTASTPPADDNARKQEVTADKELEEEVPMDFPSSKKDEPTATDDDPLEDDKVKELLAGLDDV